MVTAQDLLNMANRDFLLCNTTFEEQKTFIEDQISDPFGSGDGNYLKKLTKLVPSQDEMDEVCKELIVKVQDVYPGLRIDISDYDQHLFPLFSAIYKFFIKNIEKELYIFMREFVFNNKNRKVLVSAFDNMKLPTYPKEQYGKKEFYILVIKLSRIIDDVFDDLKLSKVIDYLMKVDNSYYLGWIKNALDDGIISDNGVMDDIYKMYKKSDRYRGDLNKLEIDITQSLIIPYLEENNMLSVRLPQVEEPEEELDDDEDEDD